MRKARTSTADIKWRAFLACPRLRAFIIAFCSVERARATDVVEALEADEVASALDHYKGRGTRIQSVSHLMDIMARDEGILDRGRAIIGGQEWTAYESFAVCPSGTGGPCKGGALPGRRDQCNTCLRCMPIVRECPNNEGKL